MCKLAFIMIYVLAAIFAGCAKQPPQAPRPAPVAQGSAYVAPQSAPVLAPSYPSLGGPVVQVGTGSMRIVQGI